MAQAGWLRSEWGTTEKNREARFYSLTPKGRKQLAQKKPPGRSSPGRDPRVAATPDGGPAVNWLRRLFNTVRPGRRSATSIVEMQFHAERIDELRAQGLSQDEASRRARRQFGTSRSSRSHARHGRVAVDRYAAARHQYAIRSLRRTRIYDRRDPHPALGTAPTARCFPRSTRCCYNRFPSPTLIVRCAAPAATALRRRPHRAGATRGLAAAEHDL